LSKNDSIGYEQDPGSYLKKGKDYLYNQIDDIEGFNQ